MLKLLCFKRISLNNQTSNNALDKYIEFGD